VPHGLAANEGLAYRQRVYLLVPEGAGLFRHSVKGQAAWSMQGILKAAKADGQDLK